MKHSIFPVWVALFFLCSFANSAVAGHVIYPGAFGNLSLASGEIGLTGHEVQAGSGSVFEPAGSDLALFPGAGNMVVISGPMQIELSLLPVFEPLKIELPTIEWVAPVISPVRETIWISSGSSMSMASGSVSEMQFSPDSAQVVPLPSSMLLLASGFLGLSGMIRRKRR